MPAKTVVKKTVDNAPAPKAPRAKKATKVEPVVEAPAPAPVAEPTPVEKAPEQPAPVAEVAPVVEEPKKKTVAKKKAKTAKKTVKAKKVVKAKKPKATKKVAKKKAKVSKKKETTDIKLADEHNDRYFKLLYDGATPVGRFSGKKPKQAANKALTSIIKTLEKDNKPVVNVDIRFALQECTRWNKKKFKIENGEKTAKKYNYLGRRELLKDEVIVDHVQKEVTAEEMKKGKVSKEVAGKDGVMKYYLDHLTEKVKVQEGGATVEQPKKFILKKTKDGKYQLINEIHYKFTNKVQKFKEEKVDA